MLPIAPDTLLQQRYRILKLLGEGGFGRTYLATDRSRFDEYCAIKELTPSAQFPATVAKAKEFFKQEATLLYQLEHPQIPRFWATFEEQSRLFLVQDYIAGKTYGHLLDERRDRGTEFTEAEVWRFLLQVLPVVGYIHSKGVIHRDISPENIILRDSDLLPVLIDFGVVKEFANQLQANPLSQVNISVGKPGYSPVEQLKAGKVYPNSDLYSLAVTAIVLLTGKEPSALFDGEQMNWDWRRWTQISEGLSNVLHRMLSPKPNDRYQSAVEVFQALQSLSIPSSQPPESTEPRSTRPSEMPTMAVGGKRTLSSTNRVQTAITNLRIQSIWEKPQVFIPLGVLIALLAGLGSWFGVSQLLRRQSSSPDASTPPKQIDFSNPTIPTDSNNTSNDIIQPVMGSAVMKEGTVDANTPVKYRIDALSGQNLDIQLVAPNSQNADLTKTPLPSTTPTGTTSPSPSQTQISKPLAATQVLMTIFSPTGTPIDSQADRVVGWRGQLSSTGEYVIELRPIAGLAGSAFPYKLSVTQLATAPSPAPAGNIPGVGVPIPIGGNGINAIPNSQPNLPGNSIPSFSPSPVPIEVPRTSPFPAPLEPKRSNRQRKLDRTEGEVSPRREVQERRRSRSIDSDNPPPRRKRNRSTNSDTPTKPSPSITPDVDNTDSPITPTPETTFTPQPSENPIPPTTKNGGDSTSPTEDTQPSPLPSGSIDPN